VCQVISTVDRRNPPPVDMVNIPLFYRVFIHPRWCRISSINSICIPVAFRISTAFVEPPLLRLQAEIEGHY